MSQINTAYWRQDPMNQQGQVVPIQNLPQHQAQWQPAAEAIMRTVLQQYAQSGDHLGIHSFNTYSQSNYMNQMWASAVRATLEVTEFLLASQQVRDVMTALQTAGPLMMKMYMYRELVKYPQLQPYVQPQVVQDVQVAAQQAEAIAQQIDMLQRQRQFQTPGVGMAPMMAPAPAVPGFGNMMPQQTMQWAPVVGGTAAPVSAVPVAPVGGMVGGRLSTPGVVPKAAPAPAAPVAPAPFSIGQPPKGRPTEDHWMELTMGDNGADAVNQHGETKTFMSGFASTTKEITPAPVPAPTPVPVPKRSTNTDLIVWRVGDTPLRPCFHRTTHYLDEDGNIREKPMNDYNAHQLNLALQKINPASEGVFLKTELSTAPLVDDEAAEEEVNDAIVVNEPKVLDAVVVCDDLDVATEMLGALHSVPNMNVPLEFTSVSAMPFIVSNREHLRQSCPNLFIGAGACTMTEIHRQIEEVITYSQRLHYTLNQLATRVVNETVTAGLGLSLTIDSFLTDWAELAAHIRESYPELFDAFLAAQKTMYKRIAILADPSLESHYLRFTSGSLELLTNSGILVKDHTVVLQDSKSQTAVRKEQLADEHRKALIDNTVVMLNTHYVAMLPMSSEDLDLDLGGTEPAIISRATTSVLYEYIDSVFKRSFNDRLPATDVCLVDWNGQRLYLNETFFDEGVYAVLV